MRRNLCRGDLFYLLTYELHRKDLVHPWLFARCREVQAEDNGVLDLWAREHYKSTVKTFARNIQRILRDPDMTIGIFSHTRPIAKQFLRQIKLEFETNNDLKELFPEILWANPSRDAPKWSEDEGIVVQRKTNPKEMTVEAWGLVDHQPTSKHFRWRTYDDVVVPESVTNPEAIAKTTRAWELSDNLGAEGGGEDYSGTRYHLFDTYADMMDRGAVRVRLRPATHNGKEDGKPVLISRERLVAKRIKQGPYTFSAQMLLNPIADRDRKFHEGWLRYWTPRRKDLNVYITVDPSSGKRGDGKKDRDYTSMWVFGIDGRFNYMVLNMVRAKWTLTERTNALFQFVRYYQPIRVGYEQYGLQADVEHIKFVQDQQNYRFDIVELGGSMAKNDRIERLVPVFEQGRFFLPHSCIHKLEGHAIDMTKVFVTEEYMPYPVLKHDDMFDGAARILDEDMQVRAPEPPRVEPFDAIAAAKRTQRGSDTGYMGG